MLSRFEADGENQLDIQFEVVNLYNRVDRFSDTKYSQILFESYKYDYLINENEKDFGILSIPVINNGNEVLTIDNVDSESDALSFEYKTYIHPKEESNIKVIIDKKKIVEAKQKLVTTIYSDSKKQSIANIIITVSK